MNKKSTKAKRPVVARKVEPVVGHGKWHVRVLVCGKLCGEYHFRTEKRANEFADTSRVFYGALGCYYIVYKAGKTELENETAIYNAISTPNPTVDPRPTGKGEKQ